MIRSSASAQGIAMMLVATACFTANDIMLKLALVSLPASQGLFLRGLGSIVIGLPLLIAMGYSRHLPALLLPRVQTRNALELLSVIGFVFGLAHAPLADITALGQTSPLLLLLGAAVLFGERLGRRRLSLILLSFVGALLVAQPGSSAFTPYALLGLWSAFAVAGRDLVGRGMDVAVPGLVIAVGAGGVEILGAAVIGVFETWTWPSLAAIGLAFGSSALLIVGHWLLIGAYRATSVGVIAPFFYVSTIWALIGGVLVFGTMPNDVAMAGIALIVTCGTLVVVFQTRIHKMVVPEAT